MGNIPQSQIGVNPNDMQPNKLQKNPLNYKIVKCKNFEKTGTCRYNSHCTYAHGDAELRTKEDNLNQIQPSINNIMNQPNFCFDYNNMMPLGGIPPNLINMGTMPTNMEMPQQMNQSDIGQMTMAGMFDPRAMFMMGMDPNQQMNFANPTEINKEEKKEQ